MKKLRIQLDIAVIAYFGAGAVLAAQRVVNGTATTPVWLSLALAPVGVALYARNLRHELSA